MILQRLTSLRWSQSRSIDGATAVPSRLLVPVHNNLVRSKIGAAESTQRVAIWRRWQITSCQKIDAGAVAITEQGLRVATTKSVTYIGSRRPGGKTGIQICESTVDTGFSEKVSSSSDEEPLLRLQGRIWQIPSMDCQAVE